MRPQKGQEDKLKQLTDKLESGIKELFTSGKYQEYLSTMNKFHSYSVNNTILIYSQMPYATHVAGFKKWETMGRRVKKGEHGIMILAPCPYKSVKYVDAINPDTNEPLRDTQGQPLKERQEITYASFRAISIFDISQTEGQPLPQLTEELQGAVKDYPTILEAIKEIAPAPIRFEEWDRSRKGYYNYIDKEIVIKSGMSELQTVKTAIHETAHSILHKDKEHLKDSATMEVQAESIAFVVCQHLGLDTSDYSFGYLAGWSSNKELPELKSSLEIIQQTAHEVIQQIDNRILKETNIIDMSRTIARQGMEIPSIGDTHRHRHRE